jgi:hypothetical protein
LLLGEGDMADRTYSPSTVPKYKQTTEYWDPQMEKALFILSFWWGKPQNHGNNFILREKDPWDAK